MKKDKGKLTYTVGNIEHEVIEKNIKGVDVFIIAFKNRKHFADATLRVSEYKECPIHNGMVFNRKTYDRWYRSTHDCSYKDGVAGTNLPMTSFVNFWNKYVKETGNCEISIEEERLYKWLEERGVIRITRRCAVALKDFYVIGYNMTAVDDEFERDIILAHELSHVLYYVDEEYRNVIRSAWDSMNNDIKDNVLNFLHRKDYQEEILEDEYGAYIIEDYNTDFVGRLEMNKTEKKIKKYYKKALNG